MPQRPDAPRFPLVAWLEARSPRQRQIAVALIALLLLWGAIRRLASVVVARWWFDSVTDAPVWSARVGAQAWLVVGATVVTLALLGATVALVLRSGRPEQQARWVRTYHQRVGSAHRWAAVALVVVITWRIANEATRYWQEWLLFRHGGSVGTDAPELGHDLGYYLFDLPFLSVVSSWLRQLLIFCLGVAALGHLLSGALRAPVRGRRTRRLAKAHLLALGAALAVVQALHMVMVARPALAVDRSGSFDGAGYVQATVLSPVLWALAVLALVVAVVLGLALRRPGIRIAAGAVGVWSVLAVLLLAVTPAVVQSLVVAPAEAERELPYLAHNLEATTAAYRLDLVGSDVRTVTDGLLTAPTAQQLADIDRVPLFDTDQLVSTFQILQGTPATRVDDIDLDRYAVDGDRRSVMVATRNASRSDLPERGWVQEHLVYTHGRGVVVAPADRPAADGRPDLTSVSSLTPVRDEIYVGEGLDGWYVIVGTKRQEQDGAQFDADTGIALSSTWRRAMVALSTGEIEPLLSAELTDESQLLMRRGLRERLHEVAPFLSLDSQPHAAVVDDRIVWIVDTYTTASTYPYAQFAPVGELPAGSDLRRTPVNYVQASVVATVDAYSGEVVLYRTDIGESDPVLAAWEDVYPGLVQPLDAMPEAVAAHTKYPGDLLTVQSSLLGRYHVDSPEELFDGTRRWSISPAAATGVGVQPQGTAPAVTYFAPSDSPAANSWTAVRTYNPGSSSNASSARDGLAAYLVADNDGDKTATLVEVRPEGTRQITSPQVAQSVIDADPDLAREFTFLNSNGSKVSFGPMTMVPLGDAIVWVRPVIVSGTSATSTPHLYEVLVVSNGRVGRGDTASAALLDAVEG